MRPPPIQWILGAFLGAFFCDVFATDCLPDNFEGISVVGVARDTSGKLLYCEWHKPQGERQMRVDYRDIEGGVFASKDLVFGEDLSLPQVKQVDQRSGERIEVKRNQDFWLLDYQKDNQAPLEQFKAALQQVDVIDAGFDHKIRASWDALLAGEKLRIRFAAPALQRVVALRVMRKTDKECAATQADWHCMWVEADNGLVRLFIEPLKLTYDGQRRLRVFSGVVNIRDSAGNKQVAVIDYVYAEEKK